MRRIVNTDQYLIATPSRRPLATPAPPERVADSFDWGILPPSTDNVLGNSSLTLMRDVMTAATGG